MFFPSKCHHLETIGSSAVQYFGAESQKRLIQNAISKELNEGVLINGNQHGFVDCVLSNKSDIAYSWIKSMVNTSNWCNIFTFMTF